MREFKNPLNITPWMIRIPGTQRYKLLRVTKAMNAHFSTELRRILADKGAIGLVSHLMKTKGIGLAAAWEQVKYMVNDFPTTNTPTEPTESS
jgi:hypothetical protein